ncbi:glycosyltransferase family 9 protein [bacterium]|nr:glycosyltransferase family 9 protein [bacterium]
MGDIHKKTKKTVFKRIEIGGRKLLMRFFALLQPKKIYDHLPDDARKDKILLMRQDKLGDMAVTIPFFRALKQALPDSDIKILASRKNEILLKYDEFDRIIYDKHPLKFLHSLYKIFRFHPDIILDLQLKESATSTIYVIASRAKWRIRAVRPVKLPFDVYIKIGDDWHIREEMATLLGAVASQDIDNVSQAIKISEIERAFAIKFFSSVSVHRDKRIGLNISAGKPERMLNFAEYLKLCNGVIERGYTPIILYSPQDEMLAKRLVQIVKRAVLAPKTQNVLFAISLLENLRMLITPDTSMIHFASAMKIPVLAMFTANDWNCNRWLPWKVPYRFVHSRDHDTMDGIDIDEVIAKFDELNAEIDKISCSNR